MDRQSWALEPGQVAAALFSDEVSNDDKARIAARILALRPASMASEDVPPDDTTISPVYSKFSACLKRGCSDVIRTRTRMRWLKKPWTPTRIERVEAFMNPNADALAIFARPNSPGLELPKCQIWNKWENSHSSCFFQNEFLEVICLPKWLGKNKKSWNLVPCAAFWLISSGFGCSFGRYQWWINVGRTHGRTDRPTYRDAMTHLKRGIV